MLPANELTLLDPQLHVSVLIIAYNLENFISEALESVLMQEVDFDYEIVIGEDCSTDRTRDIVTKFQKDHPDKIRLILREKNLGMNENFVKTLQACKGKYIALLDGDDYWIAPYKLQKQVDFLDNHPEYSICFHNAKVVYEDGSVESHPFHMQMPKHHLSRSIPKATSTLEDIIPGNFIQTCSVMFRAGLFGGIPEWICEFPTYDWPLHMRNAEHGHIGYIDEVLGVYRVHRGGLWSMDMSHYRKFDDVNGMIHAYEVINRYFNFRFDKQVNRSVTPLYYQAATLLYDTQRFREASYYAKRYLLSLSFKQGVRPKSLLIAILISYCPKAYDFLKQLKLIFLR